MTEVGLRVDAGLTLFHLSGPSGAAMMSSRATVRASSPSSRHRFRVQGTGSSASPLLNTTILVFSIAANCKDVGIAVEAEEAAAAAEEASEQFYGFNTGLMNCSV